MSFIERYKAAFELLGHPLQLQDGLAETDLKDLTLPAALRDYYLVAGHEKKLNHSHNRLLAPKDIFVNTNRLVFMEENQNVVYWGVTADTTEDNPLVQQGTNNESEQFEWHSEGIRCAEFFEVMLFLQASLGGALEYSSTTKVAPEFQEKLKRGWQFVGELGGLQTYARPGCALSFVKWEEHSFMLFSGFNNHKMQATVAKELGIDWEDL
jgi:hypothetical protein